MLVTDIQEEGFVKKSSSSYDLSILMGMDRFFYAITDSTHHLLLLRNYKYKNADDWQDTLKQSVQDVFLSDKILQLPFRKIKFAILNNCSTLIPDPLFLEDKKETYLRQLVELHEHDSVQVSDLPVLDTKLVYGVDQSLLKWIHTSYPSALIYHSFAPFLLGCHHIMNLQKGHQVFLNVKDRLLQIALFDGQQLIFCNTFPFQTSKDFIYHVMLIYDQFGLKPETNPVVLMGMIEKESEIYQNLYRYIRHINFLTLPNFMHFGDQATASKAHFYYDLFCLKLCE